MAQRSILRKQKKKMQEHAGVQQLTAKITNARCQRWLFSVFQNNLSGNFVIFIPAKKFVQSR